MIQCFGSWFASLKYKSPPGKTKRRYTRKIFWLKILKNKRPKVENFDHFDHMLCDKCVRDWNLSRSGVLNVRKSVTLRLEESSVVFPAIFYYSIFSNVSSASEWSWRSVQYPTPPPPSSFSVDNPRRIWFPLLLHLMLNKTDTVHLTTCSLSCIWCFLKDGFPQM